MSRVGSWKTKVRRDVARLIICGRIRDDQSAFTGMCTTGAD
jgi:hypothetical protein